jgi:heme O synthase-like polyprenyltransferase
VADRAVFRVSLAYLTFLFCAMLADLGLAALR